MKVCMVSLKITIFILCLFTLQGDASRQNGFCSWAFYKNSNCSRSDFLCSDGQCIDRRFRCDGRSNCLDRSDEQNCNTGDCPSGQKFCRGYGKCILEEWFCDGVKDCHDGVDEDLCEEKRSELFAMNKALHWLTKLHRKSGSATEMWGSSVDRAAVALYLAGSLTRDASRQFIKELAYETNIQLLSTLARKKLQEISSTKLASYVNAFLVTCLNPRKFQGMDIVQELRSRVDRQENYTNPYVLLALCNAGDIITETDRAKLIHAFRAKHKPFWTDIQAGALMALACASRKFGSNIEATLHELAMELKQQQYRNGTVENFQTTALVMQALLATEKDSDPDHFDEGRALEQLLAVQSEDGSFGSFVNTYHVLPVLNCKSLAHIRTDHCEPIRREETSILGDLSSRSGPKVRVQYSLWIGDEKDLERNFDLQVPANTSFYGIMEIAAELDSRFRFEYTMKNRKPYVNSLSGLQDDPESGKFWFLHKVVEGEPTPYLESPADVKARENDHFVMWYRSGSWVN